MSSSTEEAVAARPSRPRSDHRELCRRVEAEFREMPGLTLTSAQAALLFSLDRAQCERVLGTLVAAGVLTTDGRAFARADGGRRVV